MRTRPVLMLALTLALGACSAAEDGTVDDDTTAATEPADDGDAAPAAAGGGITFVGTDTVTWESTTASTTAGSNELTLACGDAVPHGLGIDGVQDGAELAACGETATVELEAGTYTFFCTVPGHREGGMEGTLTVS